MIETATHDTANTKGDFLVNYDLALSSLIEDQYHFAHGSLPDLAPMLNRTPGVHLSECIHRLCVEYGHYTDDGTPANPTRLQFGCAWEDAVAARFKTAFPQRFHVLREVSKDGIYGNPDLADIPPVEASVSGVTFSIPSGPPAALHEIKLTWMSTKHGPDSVKLWKYWTQLKGYCAMLRCRVGVLHIGYVNGDCSFDNDGPEYHIWARRFTPLEIAKTWGLIRSTAKRIAAERGIALP